MDLISRLRDTELFGQLPDDELQWVASIVRRERYPRGHTVCRQGQPGSSLFILDSGEAIARATDPSGVVKPTGYFMAGQTFGEAALLYGASYEFTVQTTADADFLRIYRVDLDRILQDRPAIRDALGLGPRRVARSRSPRFAWLDPDERIVWVGRRHEYVLFRSLLRPGLSATLLLIGYLVAFQQPFDLPILPLFAVLACLTALWAVWEWFDWVNDYFVVTTRRVTRREMRLPSREERTEAAIQNIQNINVVREGLMAHALQFGNLVIATASASRGIVFDQIASPERVRDRIFEQLERTKTAVKAEEMETIRRDLEHHLGLTESEDLEEEGRVLGEQGWQPPAPALHAAQTRRRRPLFAIRIEEDGNIIWRKHWIALLRGVDKPLLLGILLLAIALLRAKGIAPVSFIPAAPLYLTLALLGIGVLGWAVYHFEDWRNDLYMVTPDRIVDMERSPFRLHESRREGGLGMIQNVRATRPGLLAATLNYGVVEVETAGQTGNFTFLDVADPRRVQRDIFEYIERYRQRQQRLEAQKRREELADWISAYHDLSVQDDRRREWYEVEEADMGPED